MMREEEYEAVRGTLGVQTAVIAQVPVAPAEWKAYWNRTPLRQVVLVTNRPTAPR
jgi:hypothetical protein